ncbi:hypothetical protein V8B97DRAFT_1159895 [Scleroderma yunnanense]
MVLLPATCLSTRIFNAAAWLARCLGLETSHYDHEISTGRTAGVTVCQNELNIDDRENWSPHTRPTMVRCSSTYRRRCKDGSHLGLRNGAAKMHSLLKLEYSKLKRHNSMDTRFVGSLTLFVLTLKMLHLSVVFHWRERKQKRPGFSVGCA